MNAVAEPTAAERRRHHRAHIPTLSGTYRSPGDVQVLDVSLAGVAFEATGALSPGDHCFLELHHASGHANVEVEVRWASVQRVELLRGSVVPTIRAGGAFLDVQSDGNGGLLDWLVVDPTAATATA